MSSRRARYSTGRVTVIRQPFSSAAKAVSIAPPRVRTRSRITRRPIPREGSGGSGTPISVSVAATRGGNPGPESVTSMINADSPCGRWSTDTRKPISVPGGDASQALSRRFKAICRVSVAATPTSLSIVLRHDNLRCLLATSRWIRTQRSSISLGASLRASGGIL